MKIEDVKSWPVPDCLKSVRQFLAFVGYYRRFIPNFADIATPILQLTGKDVPFVWDMVCSTAFYTLCDSLVHAPILAFPTETGQYILDTDASNFGLGGVLSVRYRVMWSMWLLIVVVLFDPHSDGIAPLSERCWLLWLCVSSPGRICVALGALSIHITSHWYDYIASRIWRV